ncbi:MAG: glutamine--fructose-6-phosphate transaminase (isomerizing) [Clostridia bacterium]|nr:glutamine--fructose-6-phosphate transaminase (isomerizing) [Clostridia bacterium]
MCGIIGAALKTENAAAEVFEGLKRLEYRGYDSAGISCICGGVLSTVKRGGRVEGLMPDAKNLSGRVAIGHTRWATHGEPSDKNAHPHVAGDISVVHNGIIENWQELKTELCSQGITFASETDSEIIVRLIDLYYNQNADEKDIGARLLYAVSKAVERLSGSYALGILCKGFDGLITVKYKSPVVVGFCGDGAYICSDIPALPQNVSSICVPEDGDIAVVTAKSVTFYDSKLNTVSRIRRPVFLGQFADGKGDYPHYMIKEIHETQRTVRETCEGFFRNTDVKRLAEYVRGADRIIITGCGTAYNAGLLAKRYFSDKCGVYCQAEIASELRYAPVHVTPATLVIAVSQSGETADTVEAALALKSAGARVVAVTNCGYSAITRIAHLVVPVCAGAEVCVAATKSYVGQLAALYLTAKLSGDVFKAQEELFDICGGVDEIFKDLNPAEKIAGMCAESSAVFFLGRGIDYAVAVEGSLKLKEISYIFSDGYPAGELKHGTIALIDENTLSIFVICDISLAEKCLNAASQITSRKGKVAVITCLKEVAEKVEDNATVWLLPKACENLSPFLSAVALQLIAYKTAALLNRDPDKPRNLAKSVTVE